MANRIAYHEMRRTLHLDERQRAIIIGTLLGDGSLVETSSKTNLRLQIRQCAAQKSYVIWKYEVLKPLVLTPPSYQTINQSWWFRTISHPELTEIGNMFYRDRRKIVPKELASLLTDEGLAVWFMDDGARDRSGLILNTQCFTRSEVEYLRYCLYAVFHIIHISLHRDKQRWRLYIGKASREHFRKIVEPFMLPTMLYKLESPVETTRRLPVLSPG